MRHDHCSELFLEFFEELDSFQSKAMGSWIQWIFGAEDAPQEVRALHAVTLEGCMARKYAICNATRY